MIFAFSRAVFFYRIVFVTSAGRFRGIIDGTGDDTEAPPPFRKSFAVSRKRGNGCAQRTHSRKCSRKTLVLTLRRRNITFALHSTQTFFNGAVQRHTCIRSYITFFSFFFQKSFADERIGRCRTWGGFHAYSREHWKKATNVTNVTIHPQLFWPSRRCPRRTVVDCET